jgi:hypothetical protein
MSCEKDRKVTVEPLPPLPGDKEPSYLVSLIYRPPKTLFGWPIYSLRSRFMSFAKIYQSEIEPILWRETKEGLEVTLVAGKIHSLNSIDNFIELKNKYYLSLEDKQK